MGSKGVRAIIIYPMNALANDQIKRMRRLLRSYKDITFGLYNGNTEYTRGKAREQYRKNSINAEFPEPLTNEILSREEMQETPPHILITNYSMLEYMLLRPKDDAVFSSAKLHFVVLDELYVYLLEQQAWKHPCSCVVCGPDRQRQRSIYFDKCHPGRTRCRCGYCQFREKSLRRRIFS